MTGVYLDFTLARVLAGMLRESAGAALHDAETYQRPDAHEGLRLLVPVLEQRADRHNKAATALLAAADRAEREGVPVRTDSLSDTKHLRYLFGPAGLLEESLQALANLRTAAESGRTVPTKVALAGAAAVLEKAERAGMRPPGGR